MADPSTNPRILIVTPEVTYLPQGMSNLSDYLSVKAGGVADFSATLIKTLFEQGADVHVALPDYRKIFNMKQSPIVTQIRWIYWAVAFLGPTLSTP
jgi:starch synthase